MFCYVHKSQHAFFKKKITDAQAVKVIDHYVIGISLSIYDWAAKSENVNLPCDFTMLIAERSY